MQGDKKSINISSILACDSCRKELKETDKHEIIIEISKKLGATPSSICTAEQIFESIKYDIAKYIVSHEYSVSCGVQEDLMIWLDEKSEPESMEKLSSFIEKYLK